MIDQGGEAGHVIEVRSPDGSIERHRVRGRIEVGRDTGDLVVADPAVSRRHLLIDASGSEVTVSDLGSSHGTQVNGHRVEGAAVVGPGDEIRIGDTVIMVIPSVDRAGRATQDVVTPVSAPGTPGRARPARSELQSFANGAVEVRFAAGTHGEKVARSFAARAAKARRQLAGLGSEGWGLVPVVNLVDPFADPDRPGQLVTSGSIIDGERSEAWMVVTPEAPPEDPHRVLALLFGAALPSAGDATILLEGYGLHLADVADGAAQLQGQVLPPFEDADPDLRAVMAVSFVRFLIDTEGEDAFRRCLAAPAGRLDDAVKETYGAPLAQLEAAWRNEAVVGERQISSGQFLRMSMQYLRPYRLKQAEIFVYMLLSLAFVSALPFVTRRLFDSAIPSGEFSEVLVLLAILGIAFTITLVAGVRQTYQTAWVSGAVTRDIQQSMFDKLQQLPTSWFHRYPQGDVLSRLFNDVGQVQHGLSDTIGQGIFQMLSLIVSVVIMFTLNVPLAIVVTIGAPLVALVYRGMASGAQERSIAVQENSSALLSVAAENYRASPVVKTFGLADRERGRFAQLAERLFRSQRRMSLFSGMFGLSVNMVVTALRLGVMGFGAWLILEGRFTVGGLVAFLAVMGEVLNPVTILTTLGQDIQASTGSIMRINEVLDAEAEVDDPSLPTLAPMQQDIRLADVTFSYTPERRALDQINVTIPAGSRVAFVGPSGSGKSTILRVLMRMYDPDEGSFLVDGGEVRHCTLQSWRDQVGVVFQDSFLFDTTLLDNIALGRLDASEVEILAAAQAAEIDSFVDQLAQGYDTLVGEEGGNLSGGQRQRVAIARALLRNPRVLLLDEATSALDPQTERQINETLQRVSHDRTVVAITHRLTSVVDYDRIFVIVEGSLVEQGTHEELLAGGGAYARLWAEQTGVAPPAEAAFDAGAALRRIPLFRDLDDEAAADVAASLRPFVLETGDVISDGGGLIVIERGRGMVLGSAVSGRPAVAAELGVGDAFGLTAVLGAPATATLRAAEPLSLLMLDNDSLASIAAAHPTVARQISQGGGLVAPASGVRLTHLTLRPPDLEDVLPGSVAPRPEDAAVQRSSGVFRRLNS